MAQDEGFVGGGAVVLGTQGRVARHGAPGDVHGGVRARARRGGGRGRRDGSTKGVGGGQIPLLCFDSLWARWRAGRRVGAVVAVLARKLAQCNSKQRQQSPCQLPVSHRDRLET